VIHSDPIDLGAKVADASGQVIFTWTAPADFSGQHQIVMTAASGEVSGLFVVPAASAPTPTASVTGTTGTGGASAPTGGTAGGGASWLVVLVGGLFSLALLATWRWRRPAQSGRRAR